MPETKFIPRQERIHVPREVNADEKGSTAWIIVEKRDFTEDHLAAIMAHWKLIAKKDETFNVKSAIESMFDIVVVTDEELEAERAAELERDELEEEANNVFSKIPPGETKSPVEQSEHDRLKLETPAASIPAPAPAETKVETPEVKPEEKPVDLLPKVETPAASTADQSSELKIAGEDPPPVS